MTENVTASTPQTIEGVTVSEPDGFGHCAVRFPDGSLTSWPDRAVRRMGLVVPEPVVACRIGDAEFTLTREQVQIASNWEHASAPILSALGAAARAHLDSEGEQ